MFCHQPSSWYIFTKTGILSFLMGSLHFIFNHKLCLKFFIAKIFSVEIKLGCEMKWSVRLDCSLVCLLFCVNLLATLYKTFKTFYWPLIRFGCLCFHTIGGRFFPEIVSRFRISALFCSRPLALLERQPSWGHRLVFVTPWEGEQFREDRKWGGGANEQARWEAQQNAENQIWHASV